MSSTIFNFNVRKAKTAIGLLSGTSIDGIDTVILQIQNSGPDTKIRIIDFCTYKIPVNVKDAVLVNSDVKTSNVADICRLNVILGKLFANAALSICKKNKIFSVDFIGSHGQTVHHIPVPDNYLGFKMKSTLQIGDPAVIANLTGITTVGDFRIADCAVGGDGAPLVPILDYILFRSSSLNRGLLNIGGIANITVIPKNCTKNDVIAFDTGPGNMLIDGLTQRLYGKKIDRNALIAKSGTRDKSLFEFLLKDKVYRRKPPKSTGREQYGKDFQQSVLEHAVNIPTENIIRTVTDFTAYTIAYNYKTFIEKKAKLDELLVSGGGSRNPLLLNLLKKYMPGVKIAPLNSYGLTVDSKEAVLFAVLANECLSGNPANLRSVTSSKKDVILGKICPAFK
jgi:anhydro-N-acetylmuramic acid kinase